MLDVEAICQTSYELSCCHFTDFTCRYLTDTVNQSVTIKSGCITYRNLHVITNHNHQFTGHLISNLRVGDLSAKVPVNFLWNSPKNCLWMVPEICLWMVPKHHVWLSELLCSPVLWAYYTTAVRSLYHHVACNGQFSCKFNWVGNQLGAWRYSDLLAIGYLNIRIAYMFKCYIVLVDLFHQGGIKLKRRIKRKQ